MITKIKNGVDRIVRRPAAITAVVAALLGTVPVGAAPAAAAAESHGRWLPLRVATYNIHAGAGADEHFDPARQIAEIRAMGADIIALEEVDVHWAARSEWRDLATEIAQALHMRVHFGPIYDLDPVETGKPRRQYGNAILSRYPIVAAYNHSITRLSTQVPDPVPQPAPGFPEVVVNVRGARVHVYATHLDYRPDPKIREMQVADTLRIMADDHRHERSPRQILLGDFNARPDAPELAPLWTRLTDAWAATGDAAGGMTYPAQAPDRRIDYVTVSRSVPVRTTWVPQTLVSDHLPVVADLGVRRGG